MSEFILEVQKFNTTLQKFDHVGYMDKIFKTKKEACNFYNLKNPNMRKINKELYSDLNPNTMLRYVVRIFNNEHLSIPPFETENIKSNMKDEYLSISHFETENIKSDIKDEHLKILLLNKEIYSCSDIFWYIIDNLQKTSSGFYYNKDVLLENLINNNFYILTICLKDIPENDENFDDYFQKYGEINFFYNGNRNIILPAFFTTYNKEIDIIWVHPQYRKNGFGTKMVKCACDLNIGKPTKNILEDATKFWEKF